MKRLALTLAVLIVASACSSSANYSESANSSRPTANSQTTATSSQTTQTTESVSTSIGDDGASLVPAPTIPQEGPAAPDFTMTLADGGTFTLSEQAKPVYMIFWAEW